MPHGIRLRVSGDYACFTRPEMKVERVSYDVMTPSAARGILEAIHWKPAIQWIVEEIRVLKPIRFQSIRRNEVGAKAPVTAIRKAMKSGDLTNLNLVVEDHRQQRAATVLAGVAYVISARFDLTQKADDSDNPGKHLDTFNRRARKGQCFHQPCLGTREFPACFELIEPDAPLPAPEKETADLGFGAPRDLGFMLYDIDHAADRSSLFFRATLDRGVMKVPAPELAGHPPMSALAALARAYDRMAARQEVPAFGYSTEKIGFLISLSPDGSIVGKPIDLRSQDGKKFLLASMIVPQPPKKASSIAPNFLWEKTAYALGVTAKEGNRTAIENEAFVRCHREWLADTDDEGLQAFLSFLDGWMPTHFAERGWPEEMKDQPIIFGLESERFDKIYLHDRQAARECWATIAEKRTGTSAICLITGRNAPVARLHPSIKGVWGAQSSGASIVSFNHGAFTSYGHEQGDNAPICESAAFAYTTALNYFLQEDNGHRIQIGDSSTVFWADGGDIEAGADAEAMFAGILGDEKITKRSVGETLKKIRAGRPYVEICPDLPPGIRFNILGLAPNTARLSVRFWLQDSFEAIAGRLLLHAEDLDIDPKPRGWVRPPSIQRLLVEALLPKGVREPFKYIQKHLGHLSGELIRSVLVGLPYPHTLLSAAIMRLRSGDDPGTGWHAAIIKACINRAVRGAFTDGPTRTTASMAAGYNKEELPVALDPHNANAAYQLGRLFAVMESAQYAALGRVNAPIGDRYYAAASATPARVFGSLLRGLKHHVSDANKRGRGRWIEPKVGEIMLMLPPDLPKTLRLEDQGRFAVGYYHERATRPAKGDDTETEGEDNGE